MNLVLQRGAHCGITMLAMLLLLLAAPTTAQEARPELPSRIGAAAWLDQAGHLDQGPELAILALESPNRPGCYWRVSLLTGARSGGIGLSSDLWVEETEKGAIRVAIGGAAVVDYDQAGAEEPAVWTPAVVVSVRW